MKLLQGPIFCLLLASISRSAQNTGPTASTPLSTTNERSTTAPAINSTASPSVEKSTVGISIKGTSGKEATQMPHLSTQSPVSPKAKGDGARTENTTETKLSTTKATVISQSLSNAVSTSQSFNSKINTSSPEDSSFRTTTLSSISVTSPENISLFQGLENAKNASASTTSPSYSSIILPVVIALIVITLSVFALVGLYRMCWKTDPGTQENGNEQPQSDKESVKLLTVKTISHESGEHSAQGKTKN
ncbi:endomucin isoform 3-T3 [Dama dama]|uniref:endomucin isoform X3 n=1 Tax=Dama dama TaxID=30532 RepID=UPI002A36BE5C|nr:endomucin isoform X3 [Dama dama]